jgi:hypothetical protein
VQHGEPTDTGIEDGDGQRSVGVRHARLWWQAARSQAAT